MVPSPNQTVFGQTVRDTWNGHISTMGSGSDFTAFQDFAGIPSLDMGFGGESADSVEEKPGTRVTRTQWLDLSALGQMEGLVGKRVLIVDEVDDTRTTLEYAVRELEKDVEVARERLGGEKTQFSIFVLHVS